MTTTRELLQMALTCLHDHGTSYLNHEDKYASTVDAISAHLAKPDETAELLREMAEALYHMIMYAKDDGCGLRIADEAIAKYKEMTK